jgi:two-component system, cell cycle response regulator
VNSFADRRGPDRVATATVLVVDDSTAIRRILQRALLGAGYRVTEAADGQAALTQCRADPPDLVLLDVDMPVMDGPTALAAMKEDAELADIPVLFLTARTSGTDVAAGLQLGANDYLRKPIDPAELAARVAVALRQSSQEKTLRSMAREADRLSTLDALTGLGNRRQLELATDELRGTIGGAAPVAVIIADIDHFKLVNDTEGHLIGDAVLRIVAARLRATVGHQHQLVRWGGEEFVALAAGLDHAAVAALAERLRSAICDSPFAIDEGRTLPITISIGCVSGRLDALDDVLQAADEALYEAKRGGRNRVATRTT